MGDCSTLAFGQNSFFLACILAGIVGSVTHCLSMCGPYMACSAACGRNACDKKIDIAGSVYKQMPYHLGRATTYGLLGFLASFLAKQVSTVSFWPYLSSAMLMTAGAVFIFSSIPNCNHRLTIKSPRINYLSGALLGFIPCGLIYAMLMVAATIANPIKAMVGMWLFVLGTMPAFMIIGIGITAISNKWQDIVYKIGRAMMAINGVALFVVAIKLVR